MSADSNGTDGTTAGANVVRLPRTITVRELGELLRSTPVDVIKELMRRGVMAAINQSVDYDMAASVAQELGFEPQPEEGGATAGTAVAVAEEEAGEAEEKLQARPPVVTVMGHVDHGKTSLLDAIRETNVTAQEAGAITQHIGAYQVEVNGHKITFIDTPGHEAFTAMRARGANVTDIAVLVVAADDGVMPQTVEAIAHAKAAEVPIIIAINKTDLPAAAPDRVKQQLIQQEVLIEEFGGDVPAIPVSAKTKEGLDDLLEHIQLVAEISELKANPDRPAEGTIIEAEKDASRGPMATVIVEKGTLRVGDAVVAGESWGKLKAMFDDRGGRISEATPAMPAEIMGLDSVPRAGEPFIVVEDERTARELAEDRRRQSTDGGQNRGTLEAVSGGKGAGRTRVVDGHAEVRAIFRVRGGRIAGCSVSDGVIRRNSLLRVLREGEIIHTSRTSSLRHFKDDVREVTAGLECGIGVERFDRFQEGDVIEAFHTEQKG